MDVTAGLPFEAVLESGLTGLVPGIEVAIIDNLGAVVTPATGVGIAEQEIDGNPDTGIYAVTLTAPSDEGQYTIVWSTNGSFDVDTVIVDDLVVRELGTVLPPIGIPASGVSVGPCSMWADINEIAACCEVDTTGDPFVLIATLTSAMTAASEVLYLNSGKQFVGACQRSVRACEDDTCLCCVQVLSRGHLVYPHGTSWMDCICHPDERIKLAGSVRSISEVTIDDVVVAASEYEVRDQRWLYRLEGVWPCSTEVTYVYGKTPPELGQRAALQLACEIYRSCAGLECALPTGVTRVTRQGVTIERAFMSRDAAGVWRTGMATVDMFLNTLNPAGIPRRATFWSASRANRYARG